jgi:hypothetical protein
MPSEDATKIRATYIAPINGYHFMRVGPYLIIINPEDKEIGRFTVSQVKEIAKTIAYYFDFLVITDPKLMALFNETMKDSMDYSEIPNS